MEIKSKYKLFYCLFILIIGTIIYGCNNKEKLYLDYNEVMLHSINRGDINQSKSSFIVFNEKDSIYLHRRGKKTKTYKIDYLDKINITSVDTVIKNLSKITFDNLTIENEKDLPQIFIVKRDSLKNVLELIEVGQSFIISKDNFEF